MELEKILVIAVLLAYVTPMFVQYSMDETNTHITGVYLGLPQVLSGDEPHYLIMTHSIAKDHDVWLKNDHDGVYLNGTCAAGQRFAGTYLPRPILFQPTHQPGM